MTNDLIPTDPSVPAGDGGDDGMGGGRPASTGRMAEIEQIMRTDIKRYFAEGLDQELAELRNEAVASVDPDAAAAPTTPLSPERSRKGLTASPEGAALASAWGHGAAFEANLKAVQSTVGEMVRGIGDARAQRAFMERFDRSLSDATRYAVYDALRAAPTFVEPVGSQDMAKFREAPFARELAEEWGSYAPEKVAKIWKSVDRLRANLTADEEEDFFDWFAGLTPAQAKPILRRLAG